MAKGNGDKGGEAVEPLQEPHRQHDGWSDLPPIAYPDYGDGRYGPETKQPHYFSLGLVVMAEKWEKKGDAGESWLVP